MNNTNKEAIAEALELLVDKGVDLSNALSEGGLLKQLGRPTKVSNYNFFCGVLYILRTGVSWRDLPAEYGNWHTIYTRYKRWSEKGFFWKLLYYLQSLKEIAIDISFIDGSIVPLHRHGGGALKKEG